MSRLATCTDVQNELRRRRAQIELARRSLALFSQQAIAAGVVDGISRVQWGPHLDAVCWHTQLLLEGWLVANGPNRDSDEWPGWAERRAEMIERQRQHWERTGATWEDGDPEPWLRYVLVQNMIFGLPPGTLKSTIVMLIANAWIWLWQPKFSFRAFSGVEANVERDSKATRDLIRSPWYRERFEIAWADEDLDPAEAGIEVRRDADSVSAWATTAGGKRISSTITSSVTGGHFDCVSGETMVATEFGEIPIERLVTMTPMPRVWSLNHHTNQVELARVMAWRRIDGRRTIDVYMSSGDALRCTGDHRIFTDIGYCRAEDCVGRSVSGLRGVEATVQSVSQSVGRLDTVYDIQVAGNHNFFASGVLVHNCLFVDDPDDADKVWNESERVRPQNRFTRAVENRVNDENRSLRLVMQQRTHPEDFTAYLLGISRWSPQAPKGWAHLCIPAEFGKGPKDIPVETVYGWRDWRTEVGEVIHRLLSPGVLADKKTKLATYEWQYNLNPERLTEGLFARTSARFFVFEGENISGLRGRPLGCLSRDELPPIVVRRDELERITLSVDAANSLDVDPGKKRSAVGLLVGACRKDDRFIMDDRTRMLGVAGTYLAIYEILASWPIERVLVELKALGAGVIAEIAAAIRRGWYVHPETSQRVDLLGPDGRRVRCEVEPYQPGRETKDQRANGALPAWQQHQVFLRDGAPWLYPQVDPNRKATDDGFIEEICGGKGKDRRDAWSQFMARYRAAVAPRERWLAMAKPLAIVGGRR